MLQILLQIYDGSGLVALAIKNGLPFQARDFRGGEMATMETSGKPTTRHRNIDRNIYGRNSITFIGGPYGPTVQLCT